MNRENIRESFFRYVFFNIMSTLGVSFYILIDTFFISKGMGTDGLTALNLCLPVFNFLNGFGLMFGMGGGSRFSMLYCHTDRKETDKVFSDAFFASLAVGAVFEIAGIFFSEQAAVLLGADDAVFDMVHCYLKMILLFSPAFILNNLFICFMRNDLAPKLAMTAVLGGSFANIMLDYLFIFKLDMGMKGAALATCFSPIISMFIMSAHFISGWNAFNLRMVRPSADNIKKIVSLGLHSFLTEVSGGIVIMVFNFAIYRLMGNTGIAAYGVIANLAIVFTAVFTGLSSGVQPLMCRVHGRQDEDALKYLLKLSVITALVMSFAAYAMVFLKTDGLVDIFNSGGSVKLKRIAEKGMRLYFVFMPFMGINSIISVYFTSLEKPFLSQLISLLRGTVIVIPLTFLFCILRSVNGIWLTISMAEFLTTIVAAILLLYDFKPYETYAYRYNAAESSGGIMLYNK